MEDEKFFVAQLGSDCDGNYPSSEVYRINLSFDEATKIADELAEWSDGILYKVISMSKIYQYQQ